VKRVRLTVVYRTSREVRSCSIKAIAKKSRHLKLPQLLQQTVRVSNKKVHKNFRKHARSAIFSSPLPCFTLPQTTIKTGEVVERF